MRQNKNIGVIKLMFKGRIVQQCFYSAPAEMLTIVGKWNKIYGRAMIKALFSVEIF